MARFELPNAKLEKVGVDGKSFVLTIRCDLVAQDVELALYDEQAIRCTLEPAQLPMDLTVGDETVTLEG